MRIGDLPLKNNRVFVDGGDRYQVLKQPRTEWAGFGELPQAAETVKMKHNVVGNKLTAVSGRNVLPVNSLP